MFVTLISSLALVVTVGAQPNAIEISGATDGHPSAYISGAPDDECPLVNTAGNLVVSRLSQSDLQVCAFSAHASSLIFSTEASRFIEPAPLHILDSSNAQGALAQLEHLHSLQLGWDGDDASPPNRGAISHARDVIIAALRLGLVPFEVDADVLGGVAIWYESHDGLHRVWVACMNDNSATVLFKKRPKGPLDACGFNVKDVERIKNFLDRGLV